MSALVETRPELSNVLAMALVNKGSALQGEAERLLQQQSDGEADPIFQAALDCFSEGIEVWRRAVEEGNALFLVPNFIKALGIRFDLFAAFGMWEGAAGDVAAAFNAGLTYLGPDTPLPGVEAVFVQLLQRIHRLAPEQRTALDDTLGEENAAFVRQYTDRLN